MVKVFLKVLRVKNFYAELGIGFFMVLTFTTHPTLM